MFFWFIGIGFLAVVLVFKSPALDYRLVIAGSILPLIDVIPGVPPVLHTLVGAVVLLTLIMLATQKRRLLRRRLLGLSIGVFVHQVLDGTWTNTKLFWWPAFGFDFPSSKLPTFGRGFLGILLEMVGLAAIMWSWKQFRFDDPERWEAFKRYGRLDRELVP